MTPPRAIDSDVGKLSFWGSDCAECGNTTPGSMRCSECNTSDKTFPLWEAQR